MVSATVEVMAETTSARLHGDADLMSIASASTRVKSPQQNRENDPPPLPTLADRIKARSRRTTSLDQTPTSPTHATTMTKPQERTSSEAKIPAKRHVDADSHKTSPRHKVLRGETVTVPAKVTNRQKRAIRSRPPAHSSNTTALPKKAAQSPQEYDQLNVFSRSWAKGGHRQVEAQHQRSSQPVSAAPQANVPLNVLRTTVPGENRPANDRDGNLDFAKQVIDGIQQRLKPKARCFGDRQNGRILHLLEAASPADNEEMLFLSGDEAAQMLLPDKFHNGPILTEGQQPLPLQTISDFLGEYYDDDARVFVQNPSVRMESDANFVKEVTIGSVKKRILGGKMKGMPWNCLELATHVEDGLRPRFLAGEDTRLLTKVKLEHTQEDAGRRSYPTGYKEVEKWALLAESGALTEPHQDSHGYSTYITVNQGLIGFGWLSYPTDEERKVWSKNPSEVPGDRFRYVVVKPGQTVYFPAGTVHFVFRLHSSGPTLAFGGHVLRCSNIVHWVKTLLEEKANPQLTNEDLTSSAPGYLDRVEKFVKQAQVNGSLDKWGGAAAVAEFLRLKENFMSR